MGLVALCCWLALRAAPPLRLDAGDDDATRSLYGFYDAESGDGERFRWSGPDARLLLHGAPLGPARLDLRLSGERLAAQGEPALALVAGERPVAAFDLVPGWRVYRVLLPPGSLADATGTARPLALRTAVSRPGAGDDARDYRPLGVPMAWLRLTALPDAATGALPRAALLTWLVAIAGAGAGRLAGARWAAATIALAGALTALWAWRDPHSLAWALPATPWALGSATILLVGEYLRARGDHVGWLGRAGDHVGSPLRVLFTLVVIAAAIGLMHAQLAVGLAIGLAIAALLALTLPAGGLGATLWPTGPLAGSPARPLALLAAIFLLALGLRLLRIDELPFGLWRDEARHGLVALRMAEDPGFRPAYVLEERVQLPGLGLYPFAAALKLFGVHPWALRLVTALAGALTVLPLYAVAAQLSGRRAVGLLAALLLAVSSWHISISRLAFPTVYEPLLSLTAWWLLLVGLGEGKGVARPLVSGLGAGVLLGVAAQTYHTGRITPLTTAWLALLLLARAPARWRRWLAWVGAAALGAGLTLAPLLAYALARPGDFNSRVGEVFLLSADALKARAPLAALDANLGRHLLMFTVEGDGNGRHHAPFRPLLDILSGLGLLLGLAALLRRLGDWRSRFLFGAVAIGLLPGLLAVDAPHGMRTFGAIAPVCIIAALGWAELGRLLARSTGSAQPGRMRAGGPVALAIFVAGLVGLNAGLYFGVMPHDPRVFGGFYPVQSWMGAYVGGSAPGRIFVPAGVRNHPSFLLLAAGRPVETFTGGPGVAVSELSAAPTPGDRILLSGYFPTEERAALSAALGPLPAPISAGPPFPDRAEATYYVLTVP